VSRITTDPGERAGVYKHLNDVPDRYRLYQHAAAYEGRDVWEEYLTEYFFENYGTDYTREYTRRAGNDWKEHMADRGRHHALATPKDVETWCTALVERMKVASAYRNYWPKLEGFYSWLHTHTEHPHVYHPFRMAAAEYPNAGAIWARKVDSWEGRDE